VIDTEDLWLKTFARRNNHDSIGSAPLHLPHELGIKAQLQHSTCAGLARQLGVDDFVVVVAQPAGTGGLQQEVGSPPPTPVIERRLEDDVSTLVHGGESVLGRRRMLGQFDDRKALAFEMLEILRLVLDALLAQDLKGRVVEIGTFQLTTSSTQILLRQMMTAEVGG